MKKIGLIPTVAFILIGFACNKTKFRSNRLDDNKWQTTTLTVDGISESNLPKLKFKDANLYKEAGKGFWYYGQEGHAKTAWQFRDKGKIFEISNQTDHIHGFEDVKASEQAIAFSGVYSVKKLSKNIFEIESTETFAHKGKKVVIIMERIK